MLGQFIRASTSLLKKNLSYLKENFGFIERADVVREIFFHFTEMKDENVTPKLGDDVEFTIQTRNGKEVAANITILPPGTVVFEDVGSEVFRGQVLKPLDRTVTKQQQSSLGGPPAASPGTSSEGEVLNGRVKYRGPDRSEEEVQFGEKDQVRITGVGAVSRQLPSFATSLQTVPRIKVVRGP